MPPDVINASTKQNLARLALSGILGAPTLRRRKPAPPVMLLMALRSQAAETQSPRKRLVLEVKAAPVESQSVNIRHLVR